MSKSNLRVLDTKLNGILLARLKTVPSIEVNGVKWYQASLVAKALNYQGAGCSSIHKHATKENTLYELHKLPQGKYHGYMWFINEWGLNEIIMADTPNVQKTKDLILLEVGSETYEQIGIIETQQNQDPTREIIHKIHKQLSELQLISDRHNHLRLNDVYQHFKGNKYVVVGQAINGINDQRMILYVPHSTHPQYDKDNVNLYVRTFSNFFSNVSEHKDNVTGQKLRMVKCNEDNK